MHENLATTLVLKSAPFQVAEHIGGHEWVIESPVLSYHSEAQVLAGGDR